MNKNSKYPEGFQSMTAEQIDEVMKDFIEVELQEGVAFYDAVNAVKSIGMMNESQSKLCQTCHVFKKRGKIYVVHFKQLLALDGKQVGLSDADLKRTKYIAQSLEKDGFVKVVNPVREIELKGLQLSILMIGDENGIRLLTPGYDNIQLEKKYTFD